MKILSSLSHSSYVISVCSSSFLCDHLLMNKSLKASASVSLSWETRLQDWFTSLWSRKKSKSSTKGPRWMDDFSESLTELTDGICLYNFRTRSVTIFPFITGSWGSKTREQGNHPGGCWIRMRSQGKLPEDELRAWKQANMKRNGEEFARRSRQCEMEQLSLIHQVHARLSVRVWTFFLTHLR